MEAAANAVNKILYAEAPSDDAGDQHGANAEVPSSNTGKEDTTVDESVAPAVEHETVTKQHETREKEAVQRERHQDHYHTTIQPLKDREVEGMQHDHVEGEKQYREIDNDAAASEAKAKAEEARSGFQDETTEGATQETKSTEAPEIGENVHHHLHETVQPVIEKETIKPSVTHKTIPVEERVQEDSQDHGVTTRSAISVDEFQNRLSGDQNPETKHEGGPDVA